MKSGKAARNLEQGGISIAQIVTGTIVVVAVYLAAMYIPGVMHKVTMKDIARNAAAKMVLETNDAPIREEVAKQAKAAGIVIGQSEIQINRQMKPTLKYTVTLRWTEQVKHVWGSTHVRKQVVSGIAEPGQSGIKNAQ